MERKARAQEVIKLLGKEHSNAKIALRYKNALELLVATILSAQATDDQINALTPRLFQKYASAEDYANADLAELEQDIRSSGFYRNKAKNLKNTGKLLVEKYNSQVPKTMEELVELPGVARKTANIVLFNAYGIIAGIAVDTHVRRLAQRLGLSENTNQDKIEKDLMNIVPKDKWMRITDLLIFHGRRVCNARKPRCVACLLNKLCPSAFTFS
ncbi:endonuclease III [miscellaneous Crenarchaeota group-1 archaeon SG8-32-3]|uniref:Endonuclease III n=1 Tax=miscellaneous Crenarchaeota group-1 archaeon SG8-32-3 TaxID=1685125 RepID=A0A0M0BTL5_9ARCH|nr:MAG: endonuclease III [miscellaneous Crenarchaeota group-1 archaeon SG8-32-3]